MPAIQTSIFELLKAGPGPSSSHTIGPMRAGFDFLQRLRALPADALAAATAVRVTLYGSLAATGKGHGTDRAALAGLVGHPPDACPPDALEQAGSAAGVLVQAGGRSFHLRSTEVRFDPGRRSLPHPNTLVFRLMAGPRVLLEQEYYSVGGGFIEWKGWKAPPRGRPRYPYATAAETRKLLIRHRLRLPDLLLANERAITGAREADVWSGLDRLLDIMRRGVERGIRTEGYLPGPIGLHRKAALMHQRAPHLPAGPDRLLVYLNAYAFAASEENAAGHVVVTAPTCGSCGVLPALAHLLRRHRRLRTQALREALLAACWVGFLAKHNASIAGAEVGCQGEIGVAASMGAAFLAQAAGAEFKVVEDAAETALEHHLGMTCDPVGGYVQIPCIERNAMGAVKAYNAYLIARAGLSDWHVVGLDTAIRAMALTGHDMMSKYKETARGGLAKCC
jgi:L-serine dehydratase